MDYNDKMLCRIWTSSVLCGLFVVSLLVAQRPVIQQKERPVALLVAAGDTSLIRAGSELPLAAVPGDVLFVGDQLETGSEPITFLHCLVLPQFESEAGPEQRRLQSAREDTLRFEEALEDGRILPFDFLDFSGRDQWPPPEWRRHKADKLSADRTGPHNAV